MGTGVDIVIHPAWLATGWPGLSETERTLLLGGARIQGRLLQMLAAYHGWADGEAVKDGPAAVLAGQSAAAIGDAATLAGAVWHARPMRQLIAAADVEAINAAVGGPVRAFALAHAALAVAPAERVDVSILASRIALTGSQCLAAWLLKLPPGLRRVALPKLPPDTVEAVLAGRDRDQGAQIMHYVARQLDETVHNGAAGA